MHIIQWLDAFGSFARGLPNSVPIEQFAAQRRLHFRRTIRFGRDSGHADLDGFL